MPNTEKLKDMLDNLVNGKPEQAQVAFHDYLRNKLHGVIGGTDDVTENPDTDNNLTGE